MTPASLMRNLYRVTEFGGAEARAAVEFMVEALPRVDPTATLKLHHVMALTVMMGANDRGRFYVGR